MIWLILILIYILSVVFGWLYVHLVYSKNGLNYNESPDIRDLFLCIIPLVNTITVIAVWLLSFPLRNYKRLDKLFKIKK